MDHQQLIVGIARTTATRSRSRSRLCRYLFWSCCRLCCKDLLEEEEIHRPPMRRLGSPVITSIFGTLTEPIRLHALDHAEGATLESLELVQSGLLPGQIQVQSLLGRRERLEDLLIEAEASEIVLDLAADSDLLLERREFLPATSEGRIGHIRLDGDVSVLVVTLGDPVAALGPIGPVLREHALPHIREEDGSKSDQITLVERNNLTDRAVDHVDALRLGDLVNGFEGYALGVGQVHPCDWKLNSSSSPEWWDATYPRQRFTQLVNLYHRWSNHRCPTGIRFSLR